MSLVGDDYTKKWWRSTERN